MNKQLYTYKNGVIYHSDNPTINWCYQYVDVHGSRYMSSGFSSMQAALHCFNDFLLYSGHIYSERQAELEMGGQIDAAPKQITEMDINNVWQFLRQPIDISGRKPSKSSYIQ